MLKLKNIADFKALYEYQNKFSYPYHFSIDFDLWKKSFLEDTDGEGHMLFRSLKSVAAYEENQIAGYIQFGYTAFGFSEDGNISDKISYPVIRQFYFDKSNSNAGNMLLEYALKELSSDKKIFAFLHFFGMSCYARHGKLFENYSYIEELLEKYNFETEHENVYYSKILNEKILETPDDPDSNVEIIWKEITKGNHQYCKFLNNGNFVGECELQFIGKTKIAYLRWIYICECLQGTGIGSECLNKLIHHLISIGYTQFDTDTAIINYPAQLFYEKNGFKKEGITRSYFLKRK